MAETTSYFNKVRIFALNIIIYIKFKHLTNSYQNNHCERILSHYSFLDDVRLRNSYITQTEMQVKTKIFQIEHKKTYFNSILQYINKNSELVSISVEINIFIQGLFHSQFVHSFILELKQTFSLHSAKNVYKSSRFTYKAPTCTDFKL